MSYVDNDELLNEIIEYKKTGVFSDKLGEMILLIAKGYASKGNFSNYTWIEDMIQEASLTCVKYIRNFDPKKSDNAFSYVSTICQRSFINWINKQNKHSEIKDILHKNQDIFNESDYDEALDYTKAMYKV